MDTADNRDTMIENNLDKPIAEHVESQPLPMAPMIFGNAKSIMQAIHEFVERDSPLRAVQLNVEDRPILATLVEIGYATQDDVTDILGITTDGRLFIGIKPEGVLDLPVQVAEVTGNVAESELAARYCEGKIAAIDRAINMGDEPRYSRAVTWKESYEHAAIVLREMAREFRQGLHVPSRVIEGRVIPYNEDRSTGLAHANALRLFFIDVHERNLKAGWWTDISTGFPLKRNVGEMFTLMVTELAEAYLAWMDKAADDKLPHYPGVGVEIGDLAIRLADFCGALYAGRIIDSSPQVGNPGDQMFAEIVEIAQKYEAIRKTPLACGEEEVADFLPAMDVAVMIDAKLAYNAQREDHKIENRLKEDGKRT